MITSCNVVCVVYLLNEYFKQNRQDVARRICGLLFDSRSFHTTVCVVRRSKLLY